MPRWPEPCCNIERRWLIPVLKFNAKYAASPRRMSVNSYENYSGVGADPTHPMVHWLCDGTWPLSDRQWMSPILNFGCIDWNL